MNVFAAADLTHESLLESYRSAKRFDLKLVYVTEAWHPLSVRYVAWHALRRAVRKADFIGPTRRQALTLWGKTRHHLGLPADPHRLNERLLDYVRRERPDVVFAMKHNFLRPSTLKKLKGLGARIVSWSGDDMYAPHNRSVYYAKGLKYADLVCTQKSYNCRPEELPALGAKRLLFQDKSFELELHRPVGDFGGRFKQEISFVGTYEGFRHEQMEYLAERGLTVRVFGSGWKGRALSPRLLVSEGDLIGDPYAACLGSSAVSLGFLRKVNRDLQTCRTVEIPACGGFLLAERTEEHARLFEEGSEAEFFESKEELYEKASYYLRHPEARKRVAAAGMRRALGSDYSFDRRMREILDRLQTLPL